MANTLSLVIGSFLLCWAPISLYFLAVTITKNRNLVLDSSYGKAFHAFAVAVAHMNPAIDPLIYAYRMKEVRDGIKRMLNFGHAPSHSHKNSQAPNSMITENFQQISI